MNFFKIKFAKTSAVYFICTLFVVAGLFSQTPKVYASTINAPTDYLALNAGLVGWWTFDGNALSSTTATDMSGNGNNGTLVNGPTPTVGKVGQALKFDGSSNYVTVLDNSSLSPTAITVSAWIKATSFPNSYNAIVHHGDSSNFYEYFVKSTGKMAVYTSISGINYDGSGSHTLLPNIWYFVSFSYDATNGLIGYVNGQVDGTVIASGALNGGHGPLSIGRDSYTSGRIFNGSIDDVRIYNRALSANEVSQLYNSTAGSHTNVSQVGPNNLSQGLVGWWTFDGNALTSATATDMSGNGNNGTLVNGPTPTVGKVGQALKFDGVSQCVLMSSNSSLQPSSVTLSAWIYLTSYPVNAGVLVEKNHMYSLRISGNTGIVVLQTVNQGWNYGAQTSANSIKINQWMFLTATYVNGINDIYINGVLSAQDTSFTGNLSDGGPYPVGIGDWSQDNTCPTFGPYLFPGSLDDVRIYNRALSAGEVSQLYNLGR